MHHSLPALLILFPATFIKISTWVVHFAVALLQAVNKVSFVDSAIIEGYFSLAMPVTLLPLAFVNAIFKSELTLAMAKPIFNLPLV
jgi:hypothetical protein